MLDQNKQIFPFKYETFNDIVLKAKTSNLEDLNKRQAANLKKMFTIDGKFKSEHNAKFL